MVDLSLFKNQIEEEMRKISVSYAIEDPRGSFLDVLSAQGFSRPRSLVIGSFDRIDSPEDKPGRGSAWYIYYEDERDGKIIAFANYGDFKRGFSDFWSSKSHNTMDDYERARYHEAQALMREQQERETKKLNEESAKRIEEEWRRLPQATDNHPYLIKKQVKAAPWVKVDQYNNLVIPAAYNGVISTAQRIKAEGNFIVKDREIGNKKFEYGGKSKGAWFVISGDDTIVYIAEGYATAMSIHMATGATVYVCFQAGNIYEVTEYVKGAHPNSHIIIAGDDDTEIEINVGRKKAEQAANGLGVDVIFPPNGGDFNDYHVEYGLDALTALLKPEAKEIVEVKDDKEEEEFIRPSGVLGSIFDYYNATSAHDQKGFAIQTALAVTSVVCGRAYCTDVENFSSLYLVNVGKTATGKEHAIRVSDKILRRFTEEHFISGSSYTSAGAFYSAMLDTPRHLTVTDEFGRMLEIAKSGKNANAMAREMNTKIMEAFGRCHGTMTPPSYSTMTAGKDASSKMKHRIICNPAITFLGLTTPSTLYASLNMDAINDGFVNRFLIWTSNTERKAAFPQPPVDVPESIIDWIDTILKRYGKKHIAAQKPELITIYFTDDATIERRKFAQECINTMNQIDECGMSGLVGRYAEISMRIALVCALSDNPYATTIEKKHMEWAIWWVKKCMNQTISALKLSISGSDHEKFRNEILHTLQKAGNSGIALSKFYVHNVTKKHANPKIKFFLKELEEAGLARNDIKSSGRGRPTQFWYAI